MSPVSIPRGPHARTNTHARAHRRTHTLLYSSCVDLYNVVMHFLKIILQCKFNVSYFVRHNNVYNYIYSFEWTKSYLNTETICWPSVISESLCAASLNWLIGNVEQISSLRVFLWAAFWSGFLMYVVGISHTIITASLYRWYFSHNNYSIHMSLVFLIQHNIQYWACSARRWCVRTIEQRMDI